MATEISAAIQAQDTRSLHQIFHKLVNQAKESPKDAIDVIKSVETMDETATDALIDVLWMHSVNETSENLLTFVKELNLPLQKMFQSVDTTLLVDAPDDWPKKLRLLNTQMFYRQHKFNLMHEESEGYSKYITFLLQTDPSIDKLTDLIGTFSLDPNRCLGLAVFCLGANTDKTDALIPIVSKLCETGKLVQVLGFEVARAKQETRVWLHAMKVLVQNGLLQITEMLTYLPEWRQPLEETMDAFIKAETKRVTSLGRVRLSGGGSNSSETVTVDTKALEESVAIQWLGQLEWTDLQSELSNEEWVALCTLMPQRFGKDILGAHILSIVEPLIPEAPWSEKMVDSSSIDEVLEGICQPYSILYDSGALKLCPEVFSYTCRLLNESDLTEESETFLKKFLPSLSCFQPNPSLSMQLWQVLDRLSYQKRYEIYRAWRGSGLERAALGTSKPLWLVEGELQAGKDIRYVLKRLSKESVKDMSRAVAKVCHSFPLVVFTTILNQIESYDNLVQVMVDSLRFVTPLSLDVLGFCILGRLSGSASGVNRSRLKDDGVNVSQWLQSLESFTGAFYKKFPYMELRGVISYVMNRLKEGHVMEIGILRTLLKTAGGWAFADYSPAASLSMNQLEGRAGSILLKKETMSFGVIEDFDFRASRAVRAVLQKDDIATYLLILLAKLQDHIIFDDSEKKPIKLIGYLVDTCQAIKSILLDFMSDDSDPKERLSALVSLATSMPDLLTLRNDFKLDVPTIWMICRPLVRAAADLDDEDEMMNDMDTDALSKFRLGDDFRDTIKRMLPDGVWESLSVSLYESFHRYSSYELFCPETVYESEIERLKKEEDLLLGSQTKESEEKIERLKESQRTLQKNMAKQKEYVEKMRHSIARHVSGFFPQKKVSRESALAFLNECIFPRCMQGPDDAIYCVSFVMMLHENETLGFGTFHFLEDTFVSISRALYGSTEGEAANISILFLGLWKVVSRWRYDRDVYAAEVEDLPGSFMETEEGLKSMTFEDYEKVYNKWHKAIGSTMLGCLQSKEYMHQRNSLILLARLVEVFPTKPGLGNRLLRVLGPLQEESNEFADIRAAAQSYSMQLIRARDEGVWKEEDAATVAARVAKKEAAAKARQKEAEERMEEIKREAEKITAEIGDYEPRPRGRGPGDRPRDDRGGPRDDRRGRGPQARGHGPSDDRDRGRGPPPSDDRDRGRGPPPSDDRDRGRGPPPSDDRDRGRGPPPPRDSRPHDRRQDGPPQRQEAPRGLEGRWQRNDDRDRAHRPDDRREEPRREEGRGRKRGRSPIPEAGEANRDEAPPPRAKRQRGDDDDTGRGRSSSNRRRGGRRG